MSVETVERLDKFVIGFPCPPTIKGAWAAKLSKEEINLFHTMREEYLAKMKHIETMIKLGKHFVEKTKMKGLRRYCVLSEFTDKPLFYVQLGNINGTWVINFEWNPTKLSPDERGEFLANLEPMLYKHYDELYYKGVVSHAELAVDVYGVDISGLVLVENGRKTFTKHESTAYSGRRASPHVLTMYDKAKHLGLSTQWVRIEARIKRRDIFMRELCGTGLPRNPFGNAIILDVNQLQLVAAEFGIPELAKHIMELGLYTAVKNKQLRLKIFSRLKEVAVDWWKPEQFWSQHQALLKGLHPHQYK